MLETQATNLLDIEYPIIQGGMVPVSEAKLAAAVSEAGGFGIIASPNFETPKDLRKEIQKAKELTDKPIGVNISLYPASRPLPNEGYIEVCIDEGIKAIETSGVRSPEEFVDMLKEGGVKLIHKIAEVKHAKKAEEIGADAVGIVGVECGGHPGLNNLTTMVLTPLVSDAVDIPVIAGGGIRDGRTLIAALAMGADGIVMGTRFLATEECQIHPDFKQKLIESDQTETELVMRCIRMNTRVLRNQTVEEILEKEERLEEEDADFEEKLEELMPLISGEKSKEVFHEGSIDAGIAACGQGVGSIDEIMSVEKLIDKIVSEAGETIEKLNSLK